MIAYAKMPIGWFNDELSERACIRFNARVIKANEWKPLSDLYFFPLPANFMLLDYLRSDKLHAVIFLHETHDGILLHPDKISRLGKRWLARELRNALKDRRKRIASKRFDA